MRHLYQSVKINSLITLCIPLSLMCLLSGCYPMPTEDDFSIIPTTNNPDITREKPSGNPLGGMPGLGM